MADLFRKGAARTRSLESESKKAVGWTLGHHKTGGIKSPSAMKITAPFFYGNAGRNRKELRQSLKALACRFYQPNVRVCPLGPLSKDMWKWVDLSDHW